MSDSNGQRPLNRDGKANKAQILKRLITEAYAEEGEGFDRNSLLVQARHEISKYLPSQRAGVVVSNVDLNGALKEFRDKQKALEQLKAPEHVVRPSVATDDPPQAPGDRFTDFELMAAKAFINRCGSADRAKGLVSLVNVLLSD